MDPNLVLSPRSAQSTNNKLLTNHTTNETETSDDAELELCAQLQRNHINGEIITHSTSTSTSTILATNTTTPTINQKCSPERCESSDVRAAPPVSETCDRLIVGADNDDDKLKPATIETETETKTALQHDDTAPQRPVIMSERRTSASSMYDWDGSVDSSSTVFEHLHQLYQTAGHRGSVSSRHSGHRRLIVRKFQKLDSSMLSSTPAPDIKIGQRVAYKEYYGNEFGTIRWIGRVPQISSDWTVGVEFDNAIGEGDGSLNGRRYFIAKDCFAKFLPLDQVNIVEQHVGRPEPGTMISVMSAAVRPGQMISIQRVSTVHVQHCFLNAPHRKPGADILAVNTRLHCQCPNCGPCAHVIKPPRTERLIESGKNATHMCQFSTYTCCGMESQEEALCTYTGNKVSSLPPPKNAASSNVSQFIGNSWIAGSGYLSQLQAQQSKLMPKEYRFGTTPEDILNPEMRRQFSRRSSRGSGKQHRNYYHEANGVKHKRKRNLRDETSPDTRLDGTQSQPIISASETFSRPAYSERPATANQQETTTVNSNKRPCSCCSLDEQLPRLISPLSTTEDPINQLVGPVKGGDTTGLGSDASFNMNNNIASDDNDHYAKPKNGLPAPGKIVYRDSIENRYLFPTDEPNDSAFEADLEDLSQARYGHCPANTTRSSRNLLKSLRSLVSCLSSAPQSSNGSELDHYSERTLQFTDNQAMGGKINKSLPIFDDHHNDRNRVQTYAGLEGYEDDYHYDEEESYDVEGNNAKDKLAKPNDMHYVNKPIAMTESGGEKRQQSFREPSRQHQFKSRANRVSGSSDCGFSSASQNSMNFSHSSPLGHAEPTTVAEERRMNLVYRQIVARLLNSQAITSEDINRLRMALLEPVACCLHSDQTNNLNSPTGVQVPATGAVSNKISNDSRQYNTTETADQIISELMQKAHLSLCQHNQLEHQHHRAISSVSRCTSSASTVNKIRFRQQETLRGKFRQDNQPQLETPPSLRDQLTTNANALGSVSVGLESINDSVASSSQSESMSERSMQPVGKQSTADSSNTSCLPKAFELKLTLSINSDKSQTGQSGGGVGENPPNIVVKDVVARGTSNDIRLNQDSSYNISIVTSDTTSSSSTERVLVDQGTYHQTGQPV